MPGSPVGQDMFVRRQFNELHVRDQQLKQTKKLGIEKNWQCTIQEALPSDIRPRCELKKGAKARIGDPEVLEEMWWNWSVELLKALEELSSMTVGDLDYARELLIIEVEQRQQNPKSSQRKILELLLGDAQKVVDEQRKRIAAGYEVAMDEDNEADAMAYGGELFHARPTLGQGGRSRLLQGEHQYGGKYRAGGFAATLHGDEQGGSSPPLPTPTRPNSTFTPGPAPTANMTAAAAHNPGLNDYDLAEQLKTTEMKTRAARLRAEATRLEADAVALEVKARELREEMAGRR